MENAVTALSTSAGWVTGISLAIGFLGAVAAVLATTFQFRQGQVRLRVVPRVLQRLGDDRLRYLPPDHQLPSGPFELCVSITNLSSFDLSISSVALRLSDRHRIFDGTAWSPDSEPIHRVLPSRHTYEVIFNKRIDLGEGFERTIGVEVITGCGRIRVGRSKVFSRGVEKLIETRRPNRGDARRKSGQP